MSREFYVGLFILVGLFLGFGCSGSGGDLINAPDVSDLRGYERENNSQRMLWGIWDIKFDLTELTASVEPVREVQPHWDVTNMVMPPACYDCLSIKVNSFDTVTRVMDVNVTLKNPGAVKAYDVRGILFTNAAGHRLLNPDDWTGLYDPPGGKTINPFRAFAKDETNRLFGGNTSHMENYLLHIPKPPKYALIRYAVDVSWPKNCKEPYEINCPSSVGLYNEQGAINYFKVEVLDWQGDVNEVKLSAEHITGQEFVSLTHVDGNIWGIELTNETNAAAGDYEGILSATSANSNLLALYDVMTISINHGWARTWGGSDLDRCDSIATDTSGDVYVTGSFKEDVDFDTGAGVDEHTSNGQTDAYLVKYDSSGNFKWARTWGGSSNDFALGVSVDSSNNVYVTGSFRGTVDFDPGPGVENFTSAGLTDAYLSKFDSSGNHVWTFKLGAGLDDEGAGVFVHGYGGLYIVGSFHSTVDFDPGTGVNNHSSKGGFDAFLVNYDLDGNLVWVSTWGGSDNVYAKGIATDESGNAYIIGSYVGKADFDPGVEKDEHTSTGEEDSFLCKYYKNGTYQWSQVWGGASYDFIGGVIVDGLSNAYVTGSFRFTVDFRPGPGSEIRTSKGDMDAYLTKFNSSGVFQTVKTWGGSGFDSGLGLGKDISSNIYITGAFTGIVDFDPNAGFENHTSVGLSDIYVLKLDSSGFLTWVRTWGGPYNEDNSNLAMSPSGDAYVTGWFKDTADFDPGPGVDEHSSNGWVDIFLSKLPPDGNWSE